MKTRSLPLLMTRKVLSLACLVLLVAITTPSTLASTTTISSKTVSVPLPSLKSKKQRIPYVVSSAAAFDEEEESSSEEEVELITEEKKTKFQAVYEWYMDACTEKPFLAKGLTSAVITALGDIIAQNVEGSSGFSTKRVATFFFCNLMFTGPFIHLWYTFLNSVGDKMKERFGTVSKLKMTLTQVFLDQTLGTFVFFPLYIYVYEVFESVIRLNQLPSFSRATEKCQKHLWGIIMTQYKVFPFSNMINFGLVPYEMRVLFTSTVSLFWNIYLCSVVG